MYFILKITALILLWWSMLEGLVGQKSDLKIVLHLRTGWLKFAGNVRLKAL